MDMEGLGKLIETNHEDNLRQFKGLRTDMESCKVACSDRYNRIDERCDELCRSVKAHGKTLTQIKTIGSLASLVWGAIVLFVSAIIGELVGK
jgi:hypothetical protein